MVQTSCTKGLELDPATPFIIDSKGDGTLLFVVRALFLNACALEPLSCQSRPLTRCSLQSYEVHELSKANINMENKVSAYKKY